MVQTLWACSKDYRNDGRKELTEPSAQRGVQYRFLCCARGWV